MTSLERYLAKGGVFWDSFQQSNLGRLHVLRDITCAYKCKKTRIPYVETGSCGSIDLEGTHVLKFENTNTAFSGLATITCYHAKHYNYVNGSKFEWSSKCKPHYPIIPSQHWLKLALFRVLIYNLWCNKPLPLKVSYKNIFNAHSTRHIVATTETQRSTCVRRMSYDKWSILLWQYIARQCGNYFQLALLADWIE